MASRKTLRARQLELAREIHKEADRLAVETNPARADQSADAIDAATAEIIQLVQTLARVGA